MLSKFSVRKPFTVLVAVVICLVLGFLSFQNMSTDFLPNMEFPYALVMTTYPGASPEEVEKAVSEPVEQAMERINNVKELQSISIQNMSMVVMSFNDGTDMEFTIGKNLVIDGKQYKISSDISEKLGQLLKQYQ